MRQSRILIGLMLAATLTFGCSEKEQPAVETPVPVSQKAAPRVAQSTASETAPVAPVGNRPPRILAVPFADPYIHRGVDIQVAPEVEDADGDFVDLHYRWFINNEELSDMDAPLLPGDRFSKGDIVALWVTPADREGDGETFYGSEFEIPNAPPVFVTTPPLEFRTTGYVYAARATDPDDDPLTYLLEAAPVGMSIDSATGQITWSISAGSVGSHQVKIVAEDIEGASAVQEYTLTLSPGE